MKFAIESVGMLQVNCYIVPGKNGHLYIIDPGGDAGKIIKKAESFDYDEAVILLTHAHVDHISAAGEVAQKLNIKKVFLTSEDEGLYHSPNNQLAPFVPAAENLPETVSEIPDADFEVIHTPGHTPGCCCFYFREIPALFSGDTIFRASVGRTDLPGGNTDALMKSINEKILTLPDELEIFPGHGPSSTIAYEKANNPFL